MVIVTVPPLMLKATLLEFFKVTVIVLVLIVLVGLAKMVELLRMAGATKLTVAVFEAAVPFILNEIFAEPTTVLLVNVAV